MGHDRPGLIEAVPTAHSSPASQPSPPTDWPSAHALWASVAHTLEADILPALQGPALAVALQLSGLARYALDRGPDPAPVRAQRLGLLVGAPLGTGWAEAAGQASRLLIDSRADEPDRASAQAADVIRAVLLEFVEEDMATAAPLLETFARHGTSLLGDDSLAPDEAGALMAWISTQLGQDVSKLTGRVMSGGHSRRMLDVTVETGGTTLAFVVRVEQGGVFGTEGTSEARVMRALGEASVPVAPVRWIEETGTVLGHPFFVMDRVEGTHEVDDPTLTMFARSLDDLHHLDTAKVAHAFPVRPRDAEEGVRSVIDHWEGVYLGAARARIPLIDDAAAWLRANLRPTGPLAVVHGDPGPGNFLHSGGRLVAFTDWEFGHLGDPAEDWVYLASMRGTRLMGVAQWTAWFQDRIGISYDEDTWRAWTVFNLFKGACANITARRVFIDGASHGPNLLAVGTALHLRMVRELTNLIARR